MQAIGYARWSSLEQGRGSSLERQVGLIRSFCEAKGWNLVDQIVDEGTSAYTGANVQTGNLAALIRHIENGEVSRDVVVVVEQLDRISRLPPSQVVGWIQRVVGTHRKRAMAQNSSLTRAKSLLPTFRARTFLSQSPSRARARI